MHLRLPRPLVLLFAVSCAAVGSPTLGSSTRAPEEQKAPEYQAYRPASQMHGEVRVWGSPADRDLISSLQAGFRAFHPSVRFSTRLYGPESTFASVYTGVADVAFMARELREPLERMAYEWVMLARPFQVEIATSTMHADRPASTLAVFVHRTNPLTQLSMAQLDALLSAERRRGATPIRAWGDLGVEGEGAERAIRVLGPDLDSIAAQFLRERVMRGSHKWNPAYEPTGDSQIVQVLAQERWAIGVAPIGLRNEEIKPLALAHEQAGPFHLPARETVSTRTYPLARAVSVAVPHTSQKPMHPVAREFLRYILSREGQQIVEADGTYLALSAALAARQRSRIE